MSPAPRSAQVFSGDQLVLSVSDTPGVLLSTAAPGPDGPPLHPFLTGQAHDPFSEGRLAELLGESGSYPDFLQRLENAGYRVEPGETRTDDAE